MILVDTSIWVDHLRSGDPGLVQMLNECSVLSHPFVTGELALGNLPNRRLVLEAMQDLPQALVADDDEVLRFIGDKRLYGSGIGYIDAHLLAAVFLTPGTKLWTRDKRLLEAGAKLGVAQKTTH